MFLMGEVPLYARDVYLGRSTCHAISGGGLVNKDSGSVELERYSSSVRVELGTPQIRTPPLNCHR